jgi:hypothetical protein
LSFTSVTAITLSIIVKFQQSGCSVSAATGTQSIPRSKSPVMHRHVVFIMKKSPVVVYFAAQSSFTWGNRIPCTENRITFELTAIFFAAIGPAKNP